MEKPSKRSRRRQRGKTRKASCRMTAVQLDNRLVHCIATALAKSRRSA